MVDRAGAAARFAKASSLLGDLAGIALTTKRVERAAETDGRAGKAAAGRARPTPARPNSPACSPRPAWTPTADPCATPAPPPTWPPSPPSNSSPRWCTPRPGAADQNGSSLDRVDLDP